MRTITTHAAFALVTAAGLTLPALAQNFAHEDLPVRRVALHRSGVAYIEHRGVIDGDTTATLRFDAEAVNDVLKSLVALDLGGGSIEAVGLDAKTPLARRLGAFGVDLRSKPSVAELLDQLRGEEIRLESAINGRTTEGVIMGVESRTAEVGDTDTVHEQAFVSLVTDSGIQSVAIDDIRTFELENSDLARELREALAALASARNDRSATVDLHFTGEGEREVAIGYIHEAPVWKMSYRLVLPEGTSEGPRLQGWAIVENTTDADWEDVLVSLVAGRPVGFTMDLHTPLFVSRPAMPVPFIAGVTPEKYEAAMRSGASLITQSSRSPSHTSDDANAKDSEVITGRFTAFRGAPAQAPAEVEAQGRGEEIGEVFQFTLESPLTIKRGRAAMAPLVSERVEGRRVSIYRRLDGRTHPMRGLEITNSTDVALPAGPVTVFDASAYAGDALLDRVPEGAERLLTYAVDLDVTVAVDSVGTQDTLGLRIEDGVLIERRMSKRRTTHTFVNEDQSRARTILLEHPKWSGAEIIGDDTPVEETESAYRFELDLDAGATGEIVVEEQRVRFERYAVTSVDLDRLLLFVQEGRASQGVLEAVKKAASMQSRINGIERALRELDRERQEIANDQSRIRQNMQRIDRQSDLYARYLRKMTAQEDRLETIAEERASLQSELDATRRELNAYLQDLDVA